MFDTQGSSPTRIYKLVRMDDTHLCHPTLENRIVFHGPSRLRRSPSTTAGCRAALSAPQPKQSKWRGSCRLISGAVAVTSGATCSPLSLTHRSRLRVQRVRIARCCWRRQGVQEGSAIPTPGERNKSSRCLHSHRYQPLRVAHGLAVATGLS